MKSDLKGFHRLSPYERLDKLREMCKLTDDEITTLRNGGYLDLEYANKMIENVIGTIQIPLGIATNFLINNRDYLVPMAIEESSVVAAASNAAKLARPAGGFIAEVDEPIMIGQIQLKNLKNIGKAKKIIASKQSAIRKLVNRDDSTLVKMGGGFRGVELREVKINNENMLIIHLLVDVRDAMGANAINTMCEHLAPHLEEWTGGKTGLKIISNLAEHRLAKARAIWRADILEKSFSNNANGLSGKEIAQRIVDAYHFARDDYYRCATHNKGIMNGIDAVMIATGNDWRAAESGAHSWTRLNDKPLTHYEIDEEGNLIGEIELPMVVGLVGGATKMNPVAQISLKILGVKNAQELAGVAAAVGLANNFAALRVLATEGIQKGHMKLHATNIAAMAGARGEIIDKIAKQMIREDKVNFSRALSILKEMKGKK